MKNYIKIVVLVTIGFCSTSAQALKQVAINEQIPQTQSQNCLCIANLHHDFACNHPGCKQTFTTKNDFKKHKKEHGKNSCFMFVKSKKNHPPIIIQQEKTGNSNDIVQNIAPQQNTPEFIKISEGEFYCTLCKKHTFSKTNGIIKHTKAIVHQLNRLYGYNACKTPHLNTIPCCVIGCKEQFDDIDDFLDHMVSKHTGKYFNDANKCNEFICLACNKYSTDKAYNVRRHFANHLKELFFICPGCEKSIKNEDQLMMHLKKCPELYKILENIQANQNNGNSNNRCGCSSLNLNGNKL